jgi:hypothetical protein
VTWTAGAPYLVGQDDAGEATVTAMTWVCNTADETLQGRLIVDVFDDASGGKPYSLGHSHPVPTTRLPPTEQETDRR